jgi:hypothetical protein
MSEALDKLPSVWAAENQEKIVEFLGQEGNISLGQLYERIFRGFFADLQRRIVEQRAGFEYRITGTHVVLISFGRPGVIPIRDVIDDLLAITRKQYPSHQYFAHTGQDRDGYFGRLPQAVSVGETPVKTFREQIEDSWNDADTMRMQGPTWTSKIGGLDVLVFSAGAIAVDTSDPVKALDTINILLAMLNQQGVRCTQLTDVELGKIHINGCGQVGQWSIQTNSIRVPLYGSSLVDEETLESAFDWAKLVYEEREIADVVKLAHSAWVHFCAGEYLQAFVLQWTIAERLLTRRWIRYVEGQIAEKKRRELLVDNRDLTISLVIEILALVREIDQALYSESHSMRKVRNKVIHSGFVPSQENAGQCAGLASQLLSHELQRLASQKTLEP